MTITAYRTMPGSALKTLARSAAISAAIALAPATLAYAAPTSHNDAGSNVPSAPACKPSASKGVSTALYTLLQQDSKTLIPSNSTASGYAIIEGNLLLATSYYDSQSGSRFAQANISGPASQRGFINFTAHAAAGTVKVSEYGNIATNGISCDIKAEYPQAIAVPKGRPALQACSTSASIGLERRIRYAYAKSARDFASDYPSETKVDGVVSGNSVAFYRPLPGFLSVFPPNKARAFVTGSRNQRANMKIYAYWSSDEKLSAVMERGTIVIGGKACSVNYSYKYPVKSNIPAAAGTLGAVALVFALYATRRLRDRATARKIFNA